MKDEIEEILDKIQKCKDYDDEVLLIKQYGATLILDYITNLQQAIKDTKDTADDMLYELKQENERLKENNQNMQEEMCRCWQRIDKAIEYIEDILYPIGTCVNGSDLPYELIESLLNILQDKEEV